MTEPLNILVLFNDDHGQWALPAYGNSELYTPNIDYLANQGVVFENAFTPIPVCSPARASFFTGLMASQHGVHDYIAAAKDFHDKDWLSNHETLPKLLSGAGYHCGFSGKWHLGRDEHVQEGFDDWFSLSGDYPIEHKGAYRYSDNGEIRNLNGYKTQYIADRTIDFLRTSNDRPFFHFTSFYATHSPWAGQPERLVSRYRGCSFNDIPDGDHVFGGTVLNIEQDGDSASSIREARAQYYASVSVIDEGVGRILDELDASNRLDNTLIIYTSDHGLCLGHNGIWGKGNATAPQNMIDESIRIPMILSAPKHLPIAKRISEFADHLDLFQTVLATAGIEAPAHKYAGQNLLPLANTKAAEWRDAQFGEYGTARMIRTERYKFIQRYDDQGNELYDLNRPNGDSINIISEPGSENITALLAARLTEHFQALDCPPPVAAEFYDEKRYNHAEAWRARTPSGG